jgi:hypothetical protein
MHEREQAMKKETSGGNTAGAPLHIIIIFLGDPD